MRSVTHFGMVCMTVLALTACRKPENEGPRPGPVVNEPCPTHEPCIPNPYPPPGDWIYLPEENFVNGVRFDPLNGNEILIRRFPYGTSLISQLYRYNLTTGSFYLIYEGQIAGAMDWGENGWVLFNMNSADGWNIWKIKDTGDSLTQLTFTGNNFRSLWDPSCELIAYSTGSLGPSQYHNLSIRMTKDGVALDTLPSGCGFGGVWYEESLFYGSGIGIYALHVGDPCGADLIYALPDQMLQTGGTMAGLALTSATEGVWSHRFGLYRTHLTTGETTRLLETCNASYFSGLDYSPHTNKLLTLRWRSRVENGTDLIMENDVVLMNPDGTCQETITIPWPE